MAYHDDSIRFPPGTVSSKLGSKLLKKPPSPIDWIHQSYLEMIQDVSYDTIHYYETPKTRSAPTITESFKPNATVVVDLSKIRPSNMLPPTKEEEEEEEEYIGSKEDDDDTDSEYCNTNTTTSTDYNRKNNIYRYYKEQQSIDRPFDDDEPVFPTTTLRIVTPYSSSITTPSMNEEQTLHSNSSVMTPEDTQVPSPQRYKKLRGLIRKMRLTAEKPFTSIDNHFLSK
jgi:hypothetical protein